MRGGFNPMKPIQKPLADHILSKLKKRQTVHLSLYDLTWLVPQACEARIRFAMRDLCRRGYAEPTVCQATPGDDPRSSMGWTIRGKPTPQKNSGLLDCFAFLEQPR